MQRGDHQMAGFCGGHGDAHGFIIAHLTKQDDIRRLAQGGPQRIYIAFRIRGDFTLAHDAFLMGMQVFQRILQRDDMLFHICIDVIDHAG